MKIDLTDEEQHREYMQLIVDAANCKFGKSIHTEAQLQERLIQMIKNHNSYANQAISRFVKLNSPSKFKRNTIWDGLNDNDVAQGVAKHFWEVVS